MRFIGRWREVTQLLTTKAIDGIEKKYQGQDRLAASVDMAALDYNPQTRRAKATLDIDAGPKIKVKALEAKVSKGTLRRYVPIYQEGTVDQDLLVEGARNLRDYFQSQGYPDVEVSFREAPLQDDERTIEYVISRGTRRKLVQVEIQGNRYFTTDVIRERMLLEPSSFRMRDRIDSGRPPMVCGPPRSGRSRSDGQRRSSGHAQLVRRTALQRR
jgi:outer membrane protein assembly factor BamA